MSITSFFLIAAQAGAAATSEARLGGRAMDSEILSMILKAGPMVKAIMCILLLASIISWCIVLVKFFQYTRASGNSARFLDSFWKSRSLANLYGETGDYGPSPIAQVFRVGYQELTRVHKAKLSTSAAIENVQRALRRSATAESTRLFKYLPFLASCGNATPFIGLFGTVWGIMGSFQEIGIKGSANLAAVAPGISEALVATAAGLATAIPAVIFFNFFNSRLKILETDMSNFMSDFINILERDLLKKTPQPSSTPDLEF